MKCKKMLVFTLAVGLLLAIFCMASYAADIEYYDISASGPLTVGKDATLSLTKTTTSGNIQSADATVTEVTEDVNYMVDDSSIVRITSSTNADTHITTVSATGLKTGMTKVTATYNGETVTMMLVVGTDTDGEDHFDSNDTSEHNETLGNAVSVPNVATSYYQHVTKPRHGTTGTSLYLPNIPYINFDKPDENNQIRRYFLSQPARDNSQITELWIYNDSYDQENTFLFWLQGSYSDGNSFRANWRYTADNRLRIHREGTTFGDYQYNSAVGNSNGTSTAWGKGWNQIVIACSAESYDFYVNGMKYVSIVGNSAPTGPVTIVYDRLVTKDNNDQYMFIDDYNIYSFDPVYYDLAIEKPLTVGTSALITLTKTKAQGTIQDEHSTVTQVTAGVTYESSDPSVVTIDNGTVYARKVGKAKITASVGGEQVASMMAIVGSKMDQSRDYNTSDTHPKTETLTSVQGDVQGETITCSAPYQYVIKPAHGTSGTSLYLGNITATVSGTHYFYRNDYFTNKLQQQNLTTQATEFWFYYDGYEEERSFQFWTRIQFLTGTTTESYPIALQFKDKQLFFHNENAQAAANQNVLLPGDLKLGWNQVLVDCDNQYYNFYLNGDKIRQYQSRNGGTPNGSFELRFDRFVNDQFRNHYMYLDDFAVYDMTENPKAWATKVFETQFSEYNETDKKWHRASKDAFTHYAMRFRFILDVPSGKTVNTFGAYLVPFDKFTGTAIGKTETIHYAKPQYKEHGNTFSIDLLGIPKGASKRTMYVIPFVNGIPNIEGAFQKTVEAGLASAQQQ